MQNKYGKDIEGDKLIFYNVKSNKSYLAEQWVNLLMIIGFFLLYAFAILFQQETAMNWILRVTIAFFCCSFIYFFIRMTINDRNFSFELVATSEEISLCTRHKQWTYKVADIEKILDDIDDGYYRLVFVVKGEQVQCFPSILITYYDMEAIIKDIAEHCGLRIEKKFS